MGHSEGLRPEKSGVRAFQKQDQILHSVQDDKQPQVLRDAQDDRRVVILRVVPPPEGSGVGFLRRKASARFFAVAQNDRARALRMTEQERSE